MIVQNIHTILIIFLVLLLVAILYINYLTNQEEKKAEYYRYQLAALSAAEKTAVLAKKIQAAWDLYILIRDNIPKIKKTFEHLTDWNILKKKMCNWASNKKLLPGLIAVLKKAINRPNIKQSLKDTLTKFKNMLLKIESTIAFMSAIGPVVTTLVPSMSSSINILQNIDSNFVDLFSKAGVNICS
jgi:hypothetical protein